jgi:hypothetical protein
MQTGKGQATPGLAPHHGAPQQVVDNGLCLCTPVVYLGRGEKQGAPYSPSTIHRVLPLACIGLGNIKHKSKLVCPLRSQPATYKVAVLCVPIPVHEMGTSTGHVT